MEDSITNGETNVRKNTNLPETPGTREKGAGMDAATESASA